MSENKKNKKPRCELTERVRLSSESGNSVANLKLSYEILSLGL